MVEDVDALYILANVGALPVHVETIILIQKKIALGAIVLVARI